MEEFDDDDVAMYATVRTDGQDELGGARAAPLRRYDLVEDDRFYFPTPSTLLPGSESIASCRRRLCARGCAPPLLQVKCTYS